MPTTKKSTSGSKKTSSGSIKKVPAKRKTTAPAKKRAAGKANDDQSNTPQRERRPRAASQPPEPEETFLSNGVAFQIIPFIILIAAVLLTIAYIAVDTKSTVGFFGVFKWLFFGMFSIAAWLIPILMVNILFFWRRDYESRFLKYKITFSFLCIVIMSVFVHLLVARNMNFNMANFFQFGQSFESGGAVGGLIAYGLMQVVGPVGAFIVTIMLMFVFGVFLFGYTPLDVFRMIARYVHELREEQRQLATARTSTPQRPRPAEQRRTPPESAANASPYYTRQVFKFRPNDQSFPVKKALDVSLPEEKTKTIAEDDFPFEVHTAADDGEDALNKSNIPNIMLTDITAVRPNEQAYDKAKSNSPSGNVYTSNAKLDLEAIFGATAVKKGEDDPLPMYDDELTSDTDTVYEADALPVIEPEVLAVQPPVQSTVPVQSPAPADGKVELITQSSRITDLEPVKEVEYVYPPISFLFRDTSTKSSDAQDELRQTAEKLVESLASFKVKTKITGVSRGPTITRYELQPEVGVKVNAIRNLQDDISLSLASSGIRIEAPIPGKAAVGIEVPNKTVATVHLRELIEDERFGMLPSKLGVCLGMDVAGMPIYFDIAKMPHLLIAGATGMGKSVNINTIIMSILYKASPKEVRMILIDPKKVELNVYNGIPHLLVPVVSDPKKAAGTLNWAVNEMENRFALIEEQGVRDITGFNKVTADDPDIEYMPQIVIIIDELADLMMTAKNEVEESICRIAQKARAAGMHLIIGTQRPSVDVITGLIKANIPSRIAFTVASQIDSRTIIDIPGAERLIGRGDMLFSPVGASKPIRVQGSFVSDKEIESVCDFLRNNQTAQYDQEVVTSIEKEAAKCGIKGSKSGSDSATDSSGTDDFDSEPLLKQAIELAIESGTISTSLIQRRLSLGYARAARILDTMERMGVVGPFEGSKPRSVLMSREQFFEMIMRREE